MSWIGCTGCKVGIGATVAGIAAVCIAALVASDGAAAPVEAEIAGGAGGAALAAETGLSAARIAQIFAAAFASGGAAEFVPNAIEGICKATGACD